MAKQVTNKELLEQIEELRKLVEKDKMAVPYVAPIVIYPNHSHCTCQWCSPRPYYHPNILQPGTYSITQTGTTGTALGRGNLNG